MITIFPARRVITMNPSVPHAEAVAVRNGHILGVGTVEELKVWGKHTVDEQFADKVLMPGFIEAHCHSMSGGSWASTYVGYFDRRDPDGKLWTGCTTIEAVIERLFEAQEALETSDETLVAWGLDPIYLGSNRLVGRHLDQVSETRSIFVFHANAHLATVNTELMRRENITAETTTPGVLLGPDGQPNGELQESAAMRLATEAFGILFRRMLSPESFWTFANEARNAGITFVADLGTTPFVPNILDTWRTATDDPDYPVRVMLAANTALFGEASPEETADQVLELVATNTDKLRFGLVKLILDGSIQGYTARLNPPFYYNPPPGAAKNGIWLIAPEQVAPMLAAFHKAGLVVHAHCNGDQSSEVFIDAVAEVVANNPRPDHRHTVQHSQMTTPAQYRQMAALGMCANIFSNHIYYWGDQHRDFTLGPDRTAGMNACATAERSGVSFSLHSDAPVTPMGQLHVAWAAVNRLSATGEVLGPEERISVDSAMRAVTINAAYQLKLDHEIGSIEAGKRADFAVLEQDPYEVDPIEIKDVEVWGTVLGGVPFAAKG